MQSPDRIQKILSSQGVASRREAERMIQAGRITVDGITAVLGQRASFGVNEIAIDGVPLVQGSAPVYIMLNKPRGYVTTMHDERGRKTVVSLVADVGVRVYPVGRLDINTGGLLLMTNDGKFANTIAHPSNNITKTYEVLVRGDIAGALPLMRAPIQIDSCIVRASSVRLKKHSDGGGVLSITICEGRNRQIRKMCAQCGIDVLALKRVSIGNVTLGSLKAGCWRHLTQEELRELIGN